MSHQIASHFRLNLRRATMHRKRRNQAVKDAYIAQLLEANPGCVVRERDGMLIICQANDKRTVN